MRSIKQYVGTAMVAGSILLILAAIIFGPALTQADAFVSPNLSCEVSSTEQAFTDKMYGYNTKVGVKIERDVYTGIVARDIISKMVARYGMPSTLTNIEDVVKIVVFKSAGVNRENGVDQTGGVYLFAFRADGCRAASMGWKPALVFDGILPDREI